MTVARSAPSHSMAAAPASFGDRQASRSCPGVCLLQEQACAGAVLAWLALQDQHPPQLHCLAGGAAGSQQRRELPQQQPKQPLPSRNLAALLEAFLHLRGQPLGISHRSREQDSFKDLAEAASAARVVVQPARGGAQKQQHRDMQPAPTSAVLQHSNQVCPWQLEYACTTQPLHVHLRPTAWLETTLVLHLLLYACSRCRHPTTAGQYHPCWLQHLGWQLC